MKIFLLAPKDDDADGWLSFLLITFDWPWKYVSVYLPFSYISMHVCVCLCVYLWFVSCKLVKLTKIQSINKCLIVELYVSFSLYLIDTFASAENWKWFLSSSSADWHSGKDKFALFSELDERELAKIHTPVARDTDCCLYCVCICLCLYLMDRHVSKKKFKNKRCFPSTSTCFKLSWADYEFY